MRERTEPLVERTRIVTWKNAHREIVRRRSLATEVTERASIDFVAPHARAKKGPGKCATHSPGVVLEMKIPQDIHGHERGLRAVPAPANGHFVILGGQHSNHVQLVQRQAFFDPVKAKVRQVQRHKSSVADQFCNTTSHHGRLLHTVT